MNAQARITAEKREDEGTRSETITLARAHIRLQYGYVALSWRGG
jgi:hypothetical protein